jgi:hypothetical protein
VSSLSFDQLLELCRSNCHSARRLSHGGRFAAAAKVLTQARNCVRAAERMARADAKGGA